MVKKFQKEIINMQSMFGILSIAKHFQDYHDLYLKSDVLLLADVFENFRKTCLKHYELDPCHYYTAPGLAWDACLKETKRDLELLKDYDMLMMFEKGIRGGITHISKRYAEANNKYMKETQPSSYIQHLDANNLYGWAMSQKLPTHGFKWIDVNKSKAIKLFKKKIQIKDTYLRLISIILTHYGSHTMIIHLLQKN